MLGVRAAAIRFVLAFAFAAASAFAGCRPVEMPEVAVRPGDRVALVELRDGVLARASWLDREEGAVLGDADALVAFVLESGAVLEPDGEPLSPEASASLALTLEPPDGASVPIDACRRCLWPAEQAPQVLYPGDRCPVPPFARGSAVRGHVSPEEIEALRAAVWIDRPGECPCRRGEISRRLVPPTYSVLVPGPDLWPPDTVAVAPGGEVAIFGDRRSLRTSTRARDRAERSGRIFDGYPLAAAGLAGARFVLASRPEGGRPPGLLQIFDATLAALSARAEIDLRAATALALRSGDVVVGGARLGELGTTVPALQVCRTERDTLDCDPLEADLSEIGSTGRDPGFVGLAELDGGVVVALSNQGEIASAIRRPGGALEWRRAGRIDRLFLSPILAIGDRILACTREREAEARVTDVYAVQLSATGSVAAIERTFRSDGDCSGFLARSGGRALLLVREGTRIERAIEVDGRGRRVGPPRDLAVELGLSAHGGVERIASAAHGLTVVQDERGGLHQIDDRQGSIAPLEGAEAAPDIFVSAIAETDDELWVIDAWAREVVISFTGGGPVEHAAIDRRGAALAIAFAAFDHANDEIVVAGLLADGRSWGFGALRRSERPLVLRSVAPVGPPIERASGIVEAAPGLLAIATDAGELYWWDRRGGERIEPISVEWDLRDTPELESLPRCDHSGMLGTPSAAAGAVFAASCDGSLTRVHRGGRAERHRGDPAAIVPGLDADVAVKALCPDQAVAALSAGVGDLEARVQIFTADAHGVMRAAVVAELGPGELRGPGPSQPARPFAIAGDLSDLSIAVTGPGTGRLYRLDTTSSRLHIRSGIRAVGRVKGETLIGDEQGRLFLVR